MIIVGLGLVFRGWVHVDRLPRSVGELFDAGRMARGYFLTAVACFALAVIAAVVALAGLVD